MSPESFKCVGPGEVLAYLRTDLHQAEKSLLIIGPWLDDYFAEQVIKPASRELKARVLVRPQTEVDVMAWQRTLAALSVFAGKWSSFEGRHLERLHAKCICIDDRIVYIGSTIGIGTASRLPWRSCCGGLLTELTAGYRNSKASGIEGKPLRFCPAPRKKSMSQRQQGESPTRFSTPWLPRP